MTPTSLQHETRKRQPFDLPQQEAILSILRTNELFQHRFGQLLREYGITQPQYNALRILRGEGKPLPCLEVANRMIAVVPAITRLIDRLESAGYATKRQCSADRRVWYVEITKKGLTLLRKLDGPMREMYLELGGSLSKRECGQLIKLLEKARSSVSPPR